VHKTDDRLNRLDGVEHMVAGHMALKPALVVAYKVAEHKALEQAYVEAYMVVGHMAWVGVHTVAGRKAFEQT